MLNNTTIFDCSSQPQIIQQNSSYVDGRKPGAATVADQQAAAAAAPLKCPRCDSSNTKFCYYNNYSLSQPRHFCKACKRYWTRGGTLRNVPVGGGCRKIKPRVRQPSTKLPSGYRNTNSLDNGLDRRAGSQGQMEDANLGLGGFLYTKNNQNTEMFNGFGAPWVTDLDLGSRAHSSSGYPRSHNLGLGFSPMEYMRNQTTTDSNHLISSYSNLFGSNFSSPSGISSAYSPLMQSVLGPTFEYKKSTTNEPSSHNKGNMGNFMSALPLEDMHIDANGGRFGAGIKDEEVGYSKLNQMGSLFSQSIDPSLYNWNNGASNMTNPWSDVPNNIGSSVMSLL